MYGHFLMALTLKTLNPVHPSQALYQPSCLLLTDLLGQVAVCYFQQNIAIQADQFVQKKCSGCAVSSAVL
jgi:hypothetical protein